MRPVAYIDQIEDQPGIHWARPWRLWVKNDFGWRCIGNYKTESGARRAAKKKGYLIGSRAKSEMVPVSQDWRLDYEEDR